MPNTLAIVQFYCTYKGVGSKCKGRPDNNKETTINRKSKPF